MVKIISHANGIIFDTTSLPGSGTAFAHKMFRPRNYPSIETVALWSDKIIGTSRNGNDFNITLIPMQGAYPITEVDGLTSSDLSDLFDKFINTLS